MEQEQLRQLEERCIQEQAPFCTAACPLHVDVREVMKKVSRGDFDGGLAVLRKTLLFAGIIGRICEQPCQIACKRAEIGGAIRIAEIERACAAFGKAAVKKSLIPKKNQKIAVIGCGLSGLTAAYDLVRKGYRVVMFDQREQPGGSLLDLPPDILSAAVIADDLAVLDGLGIEMRLGTLIGGSGVAFSQIENDFDAVYVGIGVGAKDHFELETNANGCLQVSEITFESSREGVFAGGGAVSHQEVEIGNHGVKLARSPVTAMSQGRRAAVSIDRYLQKVSLTASRNKEGPYETRLYTSTAGIDSQAPVPVSDSLHGYRAEEAVEEALRCIQCQCLACVNVCEYLAHYKGYPKSYVREIYNNLSIVQGERKANTFINSCSLCGLCEEVCPTNLDMADVCLEARRLMVSQKRMPPSAHDFALRDMAFSNSEMFRLVRHAPDLEASAYVFFPGCQLSASSAGHVEAAYDYLREMLTGGVGLMLGCCGAPADWAGRTDLFNEALSSFFDDYQRLGSPVVITACSSCYQVFKTHAPDVALISLWEVMDQYGLPQGAPAVLPDVIAVHDACSTRHETVIHESVRSLLEKMGCGIEELALSREETECCSYGGLMWFANRQLAKDVIQRRIEESPSAYLAYCAMCRDFFASQGKDCYHLMDLIWGDGGDSPEKRLGPGYSQRHENRMRLKNKFLKEIWKDSAAMVAGDHENIALILLQGVQEQMDERLILIEDIQGVIAYAEKTGNKLLDQTSGHLIAYCKPRRVTYWVEYAVQGEAYVVHNAYSHRMEIEGSACDE